LGNVLCASINLNKELNKKFMEFIGALFIIASVWASQWLNDAEKKKEQEIEKRVKEKLKDEPHVNVRIIDK
jgi:hypothetical protein